MAKYDDVFIKRIQGIYENTDISLNKLAKKEKIGKATIVKWSQEFNWIKKNKTDRPPTDQTENRPTKPTKNEDANQKEEEAEKISLAEEVIDPVLKEEEATRSYKVFTGKEKMFVTYYFLYKFNIKAASLSAGYSNEREGHRVFRKPKIQKVIRRIKQIIIEKAGLNFTKEELVEELFLNLKKATGELPQVKTFMMDKFDKVTIPVSVRTFQGKLEDGTVVEGTEIYGELKEGSFKDVVKNRINENSYQVPEEFMVRDTDLKEVNKTVKLIADLYGYMDSSKLSREKFEYEKAQTGSNSEKENEIVELLRKGFGRDDD